MGPGCLYSTTWENCFVKSSDIYGDRYIFTLLGFQVFTLSLSLAFSSPLMDIYTRPIPIWKIHSAKIYFRTDYSSMVPEVLWNRVTCGDTDHWLPLSAIGMHFTHILRRGQTLKPRVEYLCRYISPEKPPMLVDPKIITINMMQKWGAFPTYIFGDRYHKPP